MKYDPRPDTPKPPPTNAWGDVIAVPASLGDWKIVTCQEIASLHQEIASLKAERDEAKEAAHYANGVADLAMKHRDEAEAEVARLTAILYPADPVQSEPTPEGALAPIPRHSGLGETLAALRAKR